MIDSLQMTAKHKLATPVNWEPGQELMGDGRVTGPLGQVHGKHHRGDLDGRLVEPGDEGVEDVTPFG